ncbi:hypothetical protein B0H67DRAFT_567481 [Lasiosphaeris hirsuta]|uniref:Uncharacterized protein n=1 Tax=Lasiosphaeris hirsuta TaxID=260670 RepID=A0AA40AYA1_9PEZI|nr:hypothetical protein B0H67DRAFT_567481 [Lasiosphaeris hirsuta]
MSDSLITHVIDILFHNQSLSLHPPTSALPSNSHAVTSLVIFAPGCFQTLQQPSSHPLIFFSFLNPFTTNIPLAATVSLQTASTSAPSACVYSPPKVAAIPNVWLPNKPSLPY